MAKILNHIKFHDYLSFDSGGLKVMNVQGLLFPLAFLTTLYQIACELGTKEQVDEILCMAGERQVNNAIYYLKNVVGIKEKDSIQLGNCILNQTEINGIGRVKIQRVDSKNKKMWAEQETEFFEENLNKIFGADKKITRSAILNYVKGGVTAVAVFIFNTDMKTELFFNEKSKKYFYVSQPGKTPQICLNNEESEKIKNILSSYNWHHMKN
jgi:hypothetical protein